ncbi:MAG: hypothetical protein ACLFPG_11575 [Desulfohalobiaceae bacterium]
MQEERDLVLFTISCARISFTEEEAKVQGFGPQGSKCLSDLECVKQNCASYFNLKIHYGRLEVQKVQNQTFALRILGSEFFAACGPNPWTW